MHCLQIFSQSVGCLFILFVVSFAENELVNLIRSHLFIFAFVSIALGDWPKKTLVWFMDLCQRTFCLCFLLGVLWYHALYLFKPLNHFEFIFVYGGRLYSNFIGLHAAAQFPSTTYWRDCLFSIVYILASLYRRLTVGYVGLFLDSQFCSIDPQSVFVPISCCCWLL